MKGQVNTELLVIVGAIILFFIPILLTVYFKASESNEQLAEYQTRLAVSRIAYLTNSVGNMGGDSEVIVEVFIPSYVRNIEFRPVGEGGEIIFRVEREGETTEVVEVVRFKIAQQALNPTGSGYMRFRISASGDKVDIEKVVSPGIVAP